ncbi:MAG: hypothetical protein IH892_22680, partial [Planctomycetes bacterium]|nr:hypothetical protein [Planctomycetota bacterium]
MSKKSIHCMCLVFLLGLTAGSAQADTTDGLLGYWPLNEGAGTTSADVSGNGSEGTLNGDPGWVPGKFGNALEFDGSDDYVDCGNSPILDLGAGDFTISAWVKTSARGGETIFAKGGDDGGGIRYRLYIEGNPGVKILVDDNSTKYDPEGNIPVEDGQWHHLVGMRDGTALRVFIDGIEDEGVTAHGESTIPDNYDISGTSQYGAYIGAVTTNSTGSLYKFYSGLIDDVAIWNRALTLDEIGFLWNNGDGNPAGGSDPEKASEPSLDDGAEDVLRDVVLSWTPGEFANTHDVYFGTAFDDVNTASVANPMDVLISAGQDGSTYNPDRLAFSQTYYWRVDEVNGTPDFTVFKGVVWSFTTEPIAIPVTQITVTASSSFGESGPERTIDGSGLMDDLHGTSPADMWISGSVPATLEYAFDRAYKLHELWIWNSNQLIEAFVGFGAKDVVIEHSLDAENWTVLEGVGPLAQAPGVAGYAQNNTIDFGGATAQYVRVTVNSVQGIAPQASLSEVRFFYIPTVATGPDPETGATDVAPDVTLAWGRDGREADHHDIYVGSNLDDVTLAGTVSESSFDTFALDLQLGQTYSWRVDEVNEAMAPSIWTGDVWSFTTVEAIIIDDMESYKDEEFLEIWATWVDGFDDPANGSLVGGASGTPETGIVHGGNQSLPLDFDNSSAPVSEATRTFDQTQDWTRSGIQTLVLYFKRGADNTGGGVYLKINDTKMVYEAAAGLPPG